MSGIGAKGLMTGKLQLPKTKCWSLRRRAVSVVDLRMQCVLIHCASVCGFGTCLKSLVNPPFFQFPFFPIRQRRNMVYEGLLDGKKVAAKKQVLSTSDDLDKFHRVAVS